MANNEETPKNLTIENFLVFMLLAAALAFSIIRLQYGVELSDEAFYAAEARLVSQGNLPYATYGLSASGFALIYAWLVSLFEYITGGTQGIFLFLKQAYLIFKILIFTGIFFLLKKHIRPQALLLFLITLLPFSPGNGFMFSYNTIPYFLTPLAAALLFNALLNQSKRCAITFSAAAGVCMAVVTFTHGAQAANAVLFGIILFIFQTIRKKKKLLAYVYTLGGITTALFTVTIIAISSGGFGKFFIGLSDSIKNTPYLLLSKPNLSDMFYRVYHELRPYFLYYLFIALCAAVSIVYAKRVKSERVNAGILFAILGITGLCLLNILRSYGIVTDLAYSNIDRALFLLPIALMVFIKKDNLLKAWLLIVLFWVPQICGLIAVSASSISGNYGRWYFLYLCAVLSILFFSLVNQDEWLKLNLWKYGVVCLSAVIIVTSCIGAFLFIYRDEPYNKLDTKVESGVYKGMLTTKYRADAVVFLQDKIRRFTSEQDSVMFMEVVPMAYLMTDSKLCTPSTWDVLQYSNGNKDDKLMLEYFKELGEKPNKIIYVDTGRDELLSIETEDYKFNQFVNENYTLTYQDDDPIFRIKIYQSKEVNN